MEDSIENQSREVIKLQDISKKDILKSFMLVTLGCFLFSYTINAVVIANHFGEGGLTGVTLLMFYTLNIDPALSSLVLNVFLLIVGYRYLEKKTMIYTILAVFELPMFLKYTQEWPVFVPENLVVASVAAGVFVGIALGLVILGKGTTAGTDIIAMMMNKYLGWPVSSSLLVIDTIVVTPLAFVIGFEKAVLTLMMLFIASKVINFILEGFNPRKAIMIISNQYELIGQTIQEQLDRGITVLDGHGFYSKDKRQVLYVVVNRQQLMPIQRIIHEIDPNAFVIITDVNQVIGEGFTFYFDDSGNKFLH